MNENMRQNHRQFVYSSRASRLRPLQSPKSSQKPSSRGKSVSKLAVAIIAFLSAAPALAHGDHPDLPSALASVWHFILHMPVGLFSLGLFLGLVIWLGGSLRRD